MAIQQHPLPQDISSYRFRLIGDMTIKQFAMLAAGIIIAIIFWSSPLPFFFKYPLAFIFLMLGIGSAFVPVQGRPLDQWIVAFIKSIYSPTQYTWRQAPPETTDISPAAPSTPAPQTPVISPTPPITESVPIPEPISTPEPEIPLSTPAPTPIPEPETPPTTVIEISVPTPAPTEQPVEQSQAPAPTTNLPIPFTPTTPNTLVGLTLTPDGRIMESVLVEILSNGLTIRATKSNRLGQFMFARPLEKGLYQISAEKSGFKFSTYSIELTNKIVAPLKIQAEGTA
ncbi:MAG: hypothetical protein UW23_C0029G0019 [Candidatus Collierbacteria bacterium GW2011_GWA1_44_12]|uniref:Minus agglutinin n=2 Tax=Candidatus Collieribacteriota TaxID=1752725 RepID=A0A0G1GII7_9BACT|nr:MAG: hypothetical protein UW23_C0029G0019 [Candidatus Collierbacteria bacterium GW2011_GWA1_44_12]